MADLDISIIIQGPIKYYEEVIDSYRGINNVLWCTWEDESEEGIKAIEESGIYVHLIKKPKYSGYWNINFQCKSSYEGLLKCKELFNTSYYIKIRSDLKINDVNLFAERFIMKNEKINFLGWANILEGFFLDYVVFGDFENMQKYWSFQDDSNNGYPCPEIYLMKRFFGYEYNIQELKSESVYKFPLLNGINLYWLSRGINIRDFSQELEFNYTEKKVFYFLKFKIKSFKIKIKNLIKKFN